MTITVSRLPSGCYRLSGPSPCDWAQVPHWPCDEKTLREHALPGASETFFQACIAQAIMGLLKETPS
jgi:hypothetical protein